MACLNRVVWTRYASTPVFGGCNLPVVDLAALHDFAAPLEGAGASNPYQSPRH